MKLILLGGTGRSFSTFMKNAIIHSSNCKSSPVSNIEPFLITDPDGFCSFFSTFFNENSTPWDITIAYEKFVNLSKANLDPKFKNYLQRFLKGVRNINYPPSLKFNRYKDSKKVNKEILVLLKKLGIFLPRVNFIGNRSSYGTFFKFNDDESKQKLVFSEMLHCFYRANNKSVCIDDCPYNLFKLDIFKKIPKVDVHPYILRIDLWEVLSSYTEMDWSPSKADDASLLMLQAIRNINNFLKQGAKVIDIRKEINFLLKSKEIPKGMSYLAKQTNLDSEIFINYFLNNYSKTRFESRQKKSNSLKSRIPQNIAEEINYFNNKLIEASI